MDEDVFIHDVDISLSWPLVLCVATVLAFFALGAVLWSRRR